jgi:hypothetical protein
MVNDGPALLLDDVRGSEIFAYCEQNGGEMTNPTAIDVSPRNTSDRNVSGSVRGVDLTVWITGPSDGDTTNESYAIRLGNVSNTSISGEIAGGKHGVAFDTASVSDIELTQALYFDDNRRGDGRRVRFVNNSLSATVLNDGIWAASIFGGVEETLATMVNTVDSGTVLIDGEYAESIDERDNVDIPKGTIIKGVSPESSVIDGGANGSALFIISDGVEVRDLTLRNTNGAGHSEDACATVGDETVFENLHCPESDNHAFRESGRDVVITRCTVDTQNVSGDDVRIVGSETVIRENPAGASVRSSATDVRAVNTPASAGLFQNGTRCTIDGLGYNGGDPSSTGDWNGNGQEGIMVRDTTNNSTYLYNDGVWTLLG